MSEKYTLARPYALAAFKLAQEEGEIDLWLDMLRFLVVVTENPDVLKIIKDPRISEFRLATLMLDIASGEFSKTGEDFIRVLVGAGRMSVAHEILYLFQKELDVFKQRTRVKVVSAYPLTFESQQEIRTVMTKRLGQEVDISVIVDTSLIGGVVIHVGDVVIDISLRGRLTQFGLHLS